MTVTSDATGRLLHSRPRTAAHFVPVLVALVDVVLLVAVTALAVLSRERLSLIEGSVQVNLGSVVAPMIVLGWAACLTAFGCYQIGVLGQGTEEYRRVLNASLVAASVVGVGCYLAQEELSRGFFILLFGIGTPTLVLGRVAARRALYAARRRGALRQRVLVIGSVSRIDEVANVLRRERWLGYDISGALTPRGDLAPETPGGVPVLGDAEDASSLVSGQTSTSCSSPVAQRSGQPTSARSCGTSSTTTSRSSSPRACPTSPPNGSTCARSAGCR